MAGGIYTTQNKVRPGVYINFVGESTLGTVGERGITTMALPLSWGESKTVLTINAGDSTSELLGYDITASQMLLTREALKRAKTLLLYRLNTGTKATVTIGTMVATAKYGGVRGNDISIVIQTNIDDPAKYDVKTLVDGEEVDVQIVATVDEVISNTWVDFSGSGTMTTTAGVPLVGGADGTVTNQDYSDYLAEVELYDFNTMALVSTDSTLKSLYTEFAKRLRDTEGKKIQVVLENYTTADYEGVISVKNGLKLSDGTTLNASQATAWVAGATAAAEVNESLTYQAYDDAVDVDIKYTNSQIEVALKAGEFLFVQNNGKAIVEKDINSLTGFTTNKGSQFSKNRVIRVLDGLANDFKRIFESYYIGKVDNNADGRSLFKNECNKQVELYQNINAVQNFNSQTDITVQAGVESDSIYIEASIQPVDSVEKIYMKVKVM